MAVNVCARVPVRSLLGLGGMGALMLAPLGLVAWDPAWLVAAPDSVAAVLMGVSFALVLVGSFTAAPRWVRLGCFLAALTWAGVSLIATIVA